MKPEKTRGLVLGKFYPLHTGHTALVSFAEKRCDELVVLLCASDREAVDGATRMAWLQETFSGREKIRPVLLTYLESELPNTSVSSPSVSRLWADKIRQDLGHIDIVFSSEPYGDYLAAELRCRHIPFDYHRLEQPISATAIRNDLHRYWDFLAPAARPHFVKKICLSGTESTGKSTLAEKLAQHFDTEFVPEMAREIVSETDACTEEHLVQIAALQAKTITEKVKTARRYLFVDTDLNITRSYSKYLFGKTLSVPASVAEAHTFDLHLYLDKDAPFIQDGTRLDKKRRDELDRYHRRELEEQRIPFTVISGDWKARLEKAVALVEKTFG